MKISSFTRTEFLIWISSVSIIMLSFCLFGRESFLTLIASLIGTTSLIFCAKGNPIGQLLMIIFSAIYGVISFGFSYYGEMITYLGMTAPMALISLVSWIKNPFRSDRSEVRVNTIKYTETAFMLIVTAAVTFIFYHILRYFHTANLIPSTVSVATSFAAAYLTFRRSAFFALIYAANDVVLIILWTMAAVKDISYLSVVICFVIFLLNDIYGFISWQKMKKRQNK